MRGDNLQESEDFILEIDDAVETFFNHYEENAPKMGDALSDSETDIVSEEAVALEPDDSLQALESDDVSEEDLVLESEDVSEEDLVLEPDDSLPELQSEGVLEEELVLEPEDSLLEPEPEDVPGEESALEPDDSLLTLDLDDVLGSENAPEPEGALPRSETDTAPAEENTLELGDFLQEPESVTASEEDSAPLPDEFMQTLEFEAISEKKAVIEPETSLLQPETDTAPVEGDVLELGDFLKEPESDTVSEGESGLAPAGLSQTRESGTVSKKEAVYENDDSSFDPLFNLLDDTEPSSANGYLKASSYLTGKKTKESEKTLKLFNSLTEAILTIDWEVNDANVKKASIVLEHIQDEFPVLKEPRPQEVVDGMMTILDALAVSPQRVPTTALSKLGKAVSILRGIAFGALAEDGFDGLIEDAIKGLADCRPKEEPAKGGAAVPENPKPSSEKLLNNNAMTVDTETADGAGGDVPKVKEPEPVSVPPGVSQMLRNHLEIVAQIENRVRRLSDMYSAVRGAEDMLVLLQKISRLLELQELAIQDAFSLNCTIAVFPIGQINSLSEFISFQRKAMGVCLKYVRSLESKCKRRPHLGKGRQAIYLLRIALEKELGELSRKKRGGNAASTKKGATVSAALSAVVREHMRVMEECMEQLAFIAECGEEYDRQQLIEAGISLREKIANQMDTLRRSLG